MTTSTTINEWERAWDRFQAATKVHSAAIEALRLLQSLPDSNEHVASALRMRLRADPKYTNESLMTAADLILETIDAEANIGFITLKESALVSACSSFEYLVKAFFVDCALKGPVEAAAMLASLRVRLDVSDVLGLPLAEQWFAIADRVFEELGKAHPTMSSRVQHFLLEHTHLPEGELRRADMRAAFEGLDCRKFNEAFLLRNCIVHNGGRANTMFARASRTKIGSAIGFKNRYVSELLKPIKQIAQQLSSIWLLPL